MWTRELLKRNAKEIFKRNYWTCVGVSLVLAALTGGGSSVIGRIGGNNTSVSYHHYGSDYYYGDSARGFMISMVVVAVTLIVVHCNCCIYNFLQEMYLKLADAVSLLKIAP